MLTKKSKLLFIIGLIGGGIFAISLNLKSSAPSPISPILQKIQTTLNAGNDASLSKVEGFDKVCIFLQDDSDEGFAKQDMNAFLSSEKITLDPRSSEKENPNNIILFIKGNNAIGVYDWKFIGKDRKGYLLFKNYEEKRNLCLPLSRSIILQNLYLSELE